MSSRLRVVAVTSSGMGPQGQIPSVSHAFHGHFRGPRMKERKREGRAMPRGCEFGTRWPTGGSPLEIHVQHVCTCCV